MPRTKAGTVPKLQHHKATGQARVTIAGRDYYCGRWGSKDSIAEYFNGHGAPPVLEGKSAASPPTSHVETVETVTVGPQGVEVNTRPQGGDLRIC